MSFTNVYYKRTAGTAKACFVCCKPTTTVLATINTVDFVYTCDTHLTDHNFASALGDTGDGGNGTAGRKLGLNEEEIAKVKEEWEAKQREKAERKEKEKDEKKDDTKDEKKEEKKKEKKEEAAKEPEPKQEGHKRYALHRDFFAMRLAEHRRRRKVAEAKALGPRLPSAPTGSMA